MFTIRKILSTLLILTTSLVHSHIKPDSPQESPKFEEIASIEVISPFFRNLHETTSAGYVIYGSKPIFLGSFCQPEWVMPGSISHKEATEAFLVQKILTTHTDKPKISDKFFIVFTAPNDSSSKITELLLINRDAFYDAVNRNLVLFKYKYGHTITPELLLNRLVRDKQSFSKVFGNEIALQGIVLGYGTDNSIAYERASTITEALSINNPSSPLHRLPSTPKTEAEMISKIEEHWGGNVKWEEIKEETKNFSYYHPQTSKDNLKIPFSFLQSSPESLFLLTQYRNAQAKLDQALKHENFALSLLKMLKIDTTQLNQSLEILTRVSPSHSTSLSKSLAKSLRYTFSEEISPEFIEGMNAAEMGKPLDDKWGNFEFLEVLREQGFSSKTRREAQTKSHNFFQQAKTLPHVETLIPNRLCISTLKQTDSPKVISPTSKTIKIHYHVKDAKGKIINGTFTDTQPLEANLAELIPGLAHGLSGMKEGEVREIYIHPDLAYGTYSEFANGKPFTVHIKLVEINGNTHKPLPPLRPVDTEHLSPNIDSCNSFTTLQKKYSFYCGYKTWLHYKKASPHLNLNTIIKELLQTQSIPQTEQEKEDLAMLNWLIYHDKLDTHYSKAENKS